MKVNDITNEYPQNNFKKIILIKDKHVNLIKKLKKKSEYSSVLPEKELLDILAIDGYELIIATDETETLLGYIVFAPYNKLNLGNIMEDLYYPDKFSEYETILLNTYSDGVFLKGLEVFEEYQEMGIGSILLEEVLKLEVPVLLYALGDSIDFWESKGFNMFEEGGYWEILV